jgi:hypothetical protein
MTDEMMTLRTLLEKSSDADLLREMIGFTAQRLMELEVEEADAGQQHCSVAVPGGTGWNFRRPAGVRIDRPLRWSRHYGGAAHSLAGVAGACRRCRACNAMNATGMIVGARLVSTDHHGHHMVAQAETHFVPGMMSGVEQAASVELIRRVRITAA